MQLPLEFARACQESGIAHGRLKANAVSAEIYCGAESRVAVCNVFDSLYNPSCLQQAERGHTQAAVDSLRDLLQRGPPSWDLLSSYLEQILPMRPRTIALSNGTSKEAMPANEYIHAANGVNHPSQPSEKDVKVDEQLHPSQGVIGYTQVGCSPSPALLGIDALAQQHIS